MRINKKLAPIPLFVSLALTGCIEVDDDSNDGVVEALNQQNAVLTEQNNLLTEQLESSQTSVTITGAVVDVDSQSPIASAGVMVYQGESVLAEGTTNENGVFSIDELPASADVTVVVSAADDSYIERAFFMSTMPVSAGEGYDDIGTLSVSKPVDIAFSVTDAQSGDAVTGLEFRGFSYSGTAGSTVNNFAHETSFNEETQQYEITLPKDLNVTLRADIDQDDDGEADFAFSNTDNVIISEDMLFILRANVLAETEIELQETETVEVEEKSVSITLLDENGNTVDAASFNFDDATSEINAEFDQTSQQYVINIPFDGSATLNMPSFSIGETTYSTGSVSLYRQIDSQTEKSSIQVNTNGFNSNSYYTVADEADLALVLVLREVQPQSTVEVITSNLSMSDYAYSVYYSEAVEIVDSDISLTYSDVNVVRGNDSTEDTVPAGFTYVLSETAEVDITNTSSLDGIKQTITPNAALEANTSYSYSIGEVTPTSGGVPAELSDDEYTFTTPVDDSIAFSINDLKLDNRNYYTNGALIVSENTAGVANTAFNYSRSVNVLLPASVETLNYLVLNFQSYNEFGSDYGYNNEEILVRDGDNFMSRSFAIDVAENENVSSELFTDILAGSTATDSTYVYRRSIGLYLQDNTASDPVTVTFTYEYQTLGGETVSGTLTLPVL